MNGLRISSAQVIGSIRRVRIPSEQIKGRGFARKSDASKPKSTKEMHAAPSNAPKIDFDPTKGNTVLHQKAARAAELHTELNALLDKQAQRRADELSRPIGSGFIEFMKKSKSEMINIFAAFTCVVLAWQIMNFRRGARKLIDNAEDRNLEVEELKRLLKVVSSDDFIARVSQKQMRQMEKSQAASKSWYSLQRNTSPTNEVKEGETLFRTILQQELKAIIGNAALSEIELEEHKLLEFQKELGIQQKSRLDEGRKSQNNAPIGNKDINSGIGGLEEFLVEVQKEGDRDRTVVVKQNKVFI